ncbi:flagellar basal-body MS-ring/collar protein FliF [Treponema sp.]|uniref:flagellar basal-body MS-ring/collar protein FliF n=1 Tax=Treponema sp. TaxID=166 RepID=UPI0025CBF845|nr:flagellar basal-body MS-ring/collar protein FliF [Treponema sp.]MCR5217621.1 flagellar M-ring protein FliF [Treponema sp.]
MNERFKQFIASLSDKWSKWTKVQKGIAIGIVLAVLAAVVWLFVGSSRPTTTRLFNAPVNSETERNKILMRLSQDNVQAYVSSDNYISVDNEKVAAQYRSILIAENLEPKGMNPYDLFNETSWSRNDFDDKVKWQHSRELAVEQHLKSLSGIRDASVSLTLPDDTYFSDNQKPVTASVVLYAEGYSDALSNKTSVKGIERLIEKSVEGLLAENISIVDGSTNKEINNFEGMEESDRISNIDKQQRLIQGLENEYRSRILQQIKPIFNKRVDYVNMKIEMDMSEKSYTAKEYGGVTLKEDNQDTPYDDSDVREKVAISEISVTESFTGTGLNPEGPSGVEGQNPAVYEDASNLIGQQQKESHQTNYVLNEKNINAKESPMIQRRTVSVNIDGIWKEIRDKDGELVIEDGAIKREYTPIEEDELKEITRLVQGAIGYDAKKGDIVTVTNIGVDHSEEFEKADAAERARKQRNKTIVLILVGVTVVLVAFILFRIITREIERRRRLREEEERRRQQEEREKALWDAKEQGMEVTMSVEERKRAELQENAVAMAKEHPEDVAMLIRTWLMEE